MCFSPAASFTASALLGVVGVASILKTKNRNRFPLAIIPLVFGLQQAIEGVLWLSLGNNSALANIFAHLFLFFALFWWPVFIPWAIYVVEPRRFNRHILVLCGLAGLAVGSYLFATYLWHPEPARVVNYCIYYKLTIPYYIPVAVLYFVATIGAGLVSSKRIIQSAAILVGFFAYISLREYTQNFTSVWCFFAAVISFVLYFYEGAAPEIKKIIE